jgi:hypothetical protein
LWLRALVALSVDLDRLPLGADRWPPSLWALIDGNRR